MPHIIIEHTETLAENLSLVDFNRGLHDCLAEQETVSLDSIKTRSIEVKRAVVGDGSNNDFVHITILLLAGRSEALKKKMAENIFNKAQSLMGGLDARLSVNIDDLGVYKK
jgi:5-carboxymethyl-2-hydroxymuconate isomerase